MLRKFKFRGESVEDDIAEKYGFRGDLLRIFSENSEAQVHKWHHYIPIYDRYFSQFRARPIRFLEIGVSKGGSLRVWRNYFGENATIYGIDNDPACASHDGKFGQVRIGSQADPDFLREVVQEMGGIDIVLDDGSHMMSHIRTSLEALFPLLSEGGIYMMEDLHAAYLPKYEGGITSRMSIFNTLREIIDDLHQWYHDSGVTHEFADRLVSGIHIHDSIAVLEKGRAFPPVHSRLGDEVEAKPAPSRRSEFHPGKSIRDEHVVVPDAHIFFSNPPRSSRNHGAVFDKKFRKIDLSDYSDGDMVWSHGGNDDQRRGAYEVLNGTFVYGGDLSGHFGHQVLENTGRAWIADHLDAPIDGTLFFPRKTSLSSAATSRALKVLEAIGVTNPICIDKPTQVGRLVVARQGWGMGSMMAGSPEMREFLRVRHAAAPLRGTGRRLYLTRRRQPTRRGHIIAEDMFEELFEREGFEIIEPEGLHLPDQLALYREASCIVGVEGSLFHVAAMAAPADCVVAIMKRRTSEVFDQICDSVGAFLGREVLKIDLVRSGWIAEWGRNRVEFLEVSMAEVWQQLNDAGIALGTPRWTELSKDQLQQRLDRLCTDLNIRELRRLPDF